METIDEVSGLAKGYASKILSPTLGKPGRRAKDQKRLSLDLATSIFLPSIGLKLQVVEDEDAQSKLGRRWTQRDHSLARDTPLGSSPWEHAAELRRAQCAKAGRISARRLSQPERSARARHARMAQVAAQTDWQRRESARNAAVKRWAAVRANSSAGIKSDVGKRRHRKSVRDIAKLPPERRQSTTKTEAQ
jgi:hypothetical protein